MRLKIRCKQYIISQTYEKIIIAQKKVYSNWVKMSRYKVEVVEFWIQNNCKKRKALMSLG